MGYEVMYEACKVKLWTNRHLPKPVSDTTLLHDRHLQCGNI